MKVLSGGLATIGVIVHAVSGIIGLVWELSFVLEKFGIMCLIISIFIFPISTIIGAILPFCIYFFTDGGWMLAVIVYGGYIIGGLFLALGGYMER